MSKIEDILRKLQDHQDEWERKYNEQKRIATDDIKKLFAKQEDAHDGN